MKNVRFYNSVMNSSSIMVTSVISNLVLATGKIFFGIYASNMTLTSDGFHSLSDLITDFITIFTLKFSKKPEDSSHPYGHRRIENFSSFVVGVILIIAVVLMVFETFRDFFSGNPVVLSPLIKILLIFWALATIPVKEFLYRKSLKCAVQEKSLTLKANAWHHRSDAYSSMVAFVSISLSFILPQTKGYADMLGSIVILLIIGKIGIDITVKGFDDLMDKSPPDSLLKSIKEIASRIPEIKSVETPKVRTLGQEFWIDMHVRMDPNISLYLSHRISHKLKDLIKDSVPSVREVLIHTEPEGFNESKLPK
ncbi:cation transporter [candidate division WOR-3 bacterium]|nr:cation transporter [candidate division WOR-3 bacterium]